MLLSFLFALQCICGDCSCEVPENPFTPICDNPMPFRNGTVWKPTSDTRGGLVILLRADLPDFDFCEVKLKDGSWDQLEYSGRTNGNRATYRHPEPGGNTFAGNRKEGGVRCFIDDGLCQFLIPGQPKNRHE